MTGIRMLRKVYHDAIVYDIDVIPPALRLNTGSPHTKTLIKSPEIRGIPPDFAFKCLDGTLTRNRDGNPRETGRQVGNRKWCHYDMSVSRGEYTAVVDTGQSAVINLQHVSGMCILNNVIPSSHTHTLIHTHTLTHTQTEPKTY